MNLLASPQRCIVPTVPLSTANTPKCVCLLITTAKKNMNEQIFSQKQKNRITRIMCSSVFFKNEVLPMVRL